MGNSTNCNAIAVVVEVVIVVIFFLLASFFIQGLTGVFSLKSELQKVS